MAPERERMCSTCAATVRSVITSCRPPARGQSLLTEDANRSESHVLRADPRRATVRNDFAIGGDF
jgi:hypothetical protein